MRTTNVSDKVLNLHQDLRIGIWLAGDHVPRLPGFISVGSRAAMDPRSADPDPAVPAVERPEYGIVREKLQRPRPTAIKCLNGESSGDQEVFDHSSSDNPPSESLPPDCRPLDSVSVASYESNLSSIAHDDSMSHVTMVVGAVDQGPPSQEVQDPKVTLKDDESNPSSLMGVESGTSHKLRDRLNQKDTASMSQKKHEDWAAVPENQPETSDLDLTWSSDRDFDECMYYHEGCDLYAEDVNGQLAVLPEGPVTTEDVRIEDIQLCRSDNQTPKSTDSVSGSGSFNIPDRQEKCTPPADRGVVCDIDVKGAGPIALICRKLRIQFREKLAELIKGRLSAKMINHSRSSWASPIVVIINLTQLMVYPMPLINDLRKVLGSILLYCSLDMARGFWVVKMMDLSP
ncbi:LOW QUALITY PROTEIN: reverse transcriptase [Phytophthora megakarya]|uniref:Reverse transcriptase n=1 Tax=Phytophthora megakarya TaxID=4795 RepID=A0A225WL78_9STRA|nr:LOW QUALITY PROTEIN: reverse transcriptase [Phytophthora megakarya]